jgi:hypothetical protein
MITNQDYQGSFTANVSPSEAVEKISRIPEWWGKDFTGKSGEPNDVFTVKFSSGDTYKARVAEILPGNKVVWEFIDTYQGWVKNTAEWVGTKIIWEVIPQKEGVEVKMTHLGLVPELECYDQCTKAWDYLLQESLAKLLNEGKGGPF